MEVESENLELQELLSQVRALTAAEEAADAAHTTSPPTACAQSTPSSAFTTAAVVVPCATPTNPVVDLNRGKSLHFLPLSPSYLNPHHSLRVPSQPHQPSALPPRRHTWAEPPRTTIEDATTAQSTTPATCAYTVLGTTPWSHPGSVARAASATEASWTLPSTVAPGCTTPRVRPLVDDVGHGTTAHATGRTVGHAVALWTPGWVEHQESATEVQRAEVRCDRALPFTLASPDPTPSSSFTVTAGLDAAASPPHERVPRNFVTPTEQLCHGMTTREHFPSSASHPGDISTTATPNRPLNIFALPSPSRPAHDPSPTAPLQLLSRYFSLWGPTQHVPSDLTLSQRLRRGVHVGQPTEPHTDGVLFPSIAKLTETTLPPPEPRPSARPATATLPRRSASSRTTAFAHSALVTRTTAHPTPPMTESGPVFALTPCATRGTRWGTTSRRTTPTARTPSLTPMLRLLRECDAPSSSSSAHESTTAAVTQRVLEMSRDQQGCRLLQAVLEHEMDLTRPESPASMLERVDVQDDGEDEAERRFAHSIAIQRVLAAIQPSMAYVMSDAYGNFLVQKLLEVAPSRERRRLLAHPTLSEHLCSVAASPHGTFAVQRLLETLRDEAEEAIVFAALQRHLLRLFLDVNGGHVLVKLMTYVRQRYLQPGPSNARGSHAAVGGPRLAAKTRFLYDGLCHDLLFVCRHQQGCCIVQKCMNFFSELHPRRDPGVDRGDNWFTGLVHRLLDHLVALAVDPYGNYVVTHLVEVCYARGDMTLLDAMAARIEQHLVPLCKNKFASNVVEHVVRHCGEERVRCLCRRLLRPSEEDAAVSSRMLPLIEIAADEYGNYVVQTLLTVAPVEELVSGPTRPGRGAGRTGESQMGLLKLLQTYLPVLLDKNFGKKLETKINLAQLRVAQQLQQHQHH